MLNLIQNEAAAFRPHDPALRGYHVVYRRDEVNHCPGCGRSHWLVGRLLAECGFCSTALPMVEGGMSGVGMPRNRYRASDEAPLAA